MPVIEPLPMDEIDAESRARIAAGEKTGMYTMTLPLQIMAHSPAAFRAMDEAYKAVFRRGHLDDRLKELLRLRSAQLNGCAPCSISRKEAGTVSEDDVTCMDDPAASNYSPRERAAIGFLNTYCADPHLITRETFRALGKHFSPGEIVELAHTCTSNAAGHRLMHMFDVLGDSEPVIRRRELVA